MDDIIEELKCISKIKPLDTYSTSARECIPRTAWSTTIYKRVYGSYEHREQMVADLKKLQVKIETYPYDSRDIRNQDLILAIVSATTGLNHLADTYHDDVTTADQLRDIVAALLLQKSKIWNKYVKDVEIVATCTPPTYVQASPLNIVHTTPVSIQNRTPASTIKPSPTISSNLSIYSSSAPTVVEKKIEMETIVVDNIEFVKLPLSLPLVEEKIVSFEPKSEIMESMMVIPSDDNLSQVSSKKYTEEKSYASISTASDSKLETYQGQIELPKSVASTVPDITSKLEEVKKSTVASDTKSTPTTTTFIPTPVQYPLPRGDSKRSKRRNK